MNARLTKFVHDMPQVKMPKNIAALKTAKLRGKKTFTEPEYRRVRIYKSQNDVSPIGEMLSESAINRAKGMVCGGENWEDKCERIRSTLGSSVSSADGGASAIMTNAVIAKSNDDVRQEVFVMQMIHYYQSVFKEEGMALFLKPYKILATSKETGLIELLKVRKEVGGDDISYLFFFFPFFFPPPFIQSVSHHPSLTRVLLHSTPIPQDATSIDGLKKSDGYPVKRGLRGYFEQVYGPPKSEDFIKAQNNFMNSLAGYSLVCYLLGLKDRHNGNIMINTKGQIIHIDFGFAFGMAPGHEWSFERAPFKLTQEYVDVLDGYGSPKFRQFTNLIVQGFMAARASSQIALGLVEIMMHRSNFPCFTGIRYGGDVALNRFRNRLMLHITDEKVLISKVKGLVDRSYNHRGTKCYDLFQFYTNGIHV